MTSQRTISRLSRILGLIPYVLANPGVDLDEVMDRFGYSQDELTRDLNSVFVCGLPGYGPGDLMEAYIDENEVIIDSADYFSRAPRLSSVEALGLLAAGLAVSGAGQGTDALQSAVKKLTKVLLPDADDVIDIDISRAPEDISVLRSAIEDRKPVKIQYRSLSREETTERVVEPWAVFTTLGNWYLMGHCRMVDDTRTFRIDRIRSIGVQNDQFKMPRSVPEPGVGYTPSDGDVTAIIDLYPAAKWVLEYYPVEVLSESKKATRIGFSSTDPELPARLLVRLGATAKLVEGEAVKDRLKALGTALIARYQ